MFRSLLFSFWRKLVNSYQVCKAADRKFAYFWQFLNFLLFANNVYFCNQDDHLTPKIRIFCTFECPIQVPNSTSTSISLDLTNWFNWNFTFKIMKISSNVVWQNMTSYDADDVLWGNFDDLTRNANTSVSIYWFYKTKNQKTFFSNLDHCCIVFSENPIPLNIQNCGLDFCKKDTYCQLCSNSQSKYMFVISKIVCVHTFC